MSQYIQLHILTAWPPSNPNRDDLGMPKTAILGGSERMRISSQCLKRAWRKSDLFESALHQHIGIRTRKLGRNACDWLQQAGMPEKQAIKTAQKIAGAFGKLKSAKETQPDDSDDKKTKKAKKAESKQDQTQKTALDIEQLAHFSPEEWADLQQLCATLGAEKRDPTAKELKLLRTTATSVDIALFGRMLASSPEFNIEAACQVAHAIGVNANPADNDFFSALDDLNDNSGAGHLGDQDFGSSIYYTYLCLNRDQLQENLGGDEALTCRTLAALTEAVAKVTPGGKQNSFASRVYASYMLAELGNQQPRSLIAAFYKPVAGTEDHLIQAIHRLQSHCDKLDEIYGACASARMTLSVAPLANTESHSLAELKQFICQTPPAKA